MSDAPETLDFRDCEPADLNSSAPYFDCRVVAYQVGGLPERVFLGVAFDRMTLGDPAVRTNRINAIVVHWTLPLRECAPERRPGGSLQPER
jgi:hypothetical protein